MKSMYKPKKKCIGDLTILGTTHNKQFECECKCGRIITHSAEFLDTHQNYACQHTNQFVDLSGLQIGNWTVLNYAGKGLWNCMCSCGVKKVVRDCHLKTGKSKSCGHDRIIRFYDLRGNRYDDWFVINYAGNNDWLCKCVYCGEERIIPSYTLCSNNIIVCEHNAMRKIYN